MKVLIVEDEEQVALMLERKLKQQGMVVDTAYDGQKGLVMAHAGIYDVILLDIMLPGIEGITFCKSLRESKVGSFIIMVSARSMLHDKLAGLEAGADDYI